MIEKLKALLQALPAWGAAAQSVLTIIAVEVVPLLPENVAVRVAAIVAIAAGWVATAVSVVARVTPVPEQAEGLVLPPNRELKVELGYLGGERIQGIVTRR